MKTKISTYQRVIPRDLFNEAKLLKCIGQVVLKIHDRQTPIRMGVIETGERFKIELLDEGYLFISNLDITILGEKYLFKTTYNSKSNYPLFVEIQEDNGPVDIQVFDENGNFDEEFINYFTYLAS